jgi:hypothetical protein
MSYLIANDYNRLIQNPTLQQIISGNNVLVKITEQSAISEMISYLVQKYDTSKEFTDTNIYNAGATYKARERVYLDALVYAATKTYAAGVLTLQPTLQVDLNSYAYKGQSTAIIIRNDLYIIADQTEGFISGGDSYVDSSLNGWTFAVTLVGTGALVDGVDITIAADGFTWLKIHTIQTGETYKLTFQSQIVDNSATVGLVTTNAIYVSNGAITSPEVFTPAHWTLLGNQYDIFYVTDPAPEFNLTDTIYPIGFIVWYKNHTYTAILPTVTHTHDDVIQFANTENFPYLNIFPDDISQGKTYWKDNGLYTVAPGSLTDPTKWTQGDNRNQQLVEYMMDVVVYKLYKRISPKDIPQGRVDAYSIVLGWLKQAAKGTDITANIPRIVPPAGQRIRFGSNVKSINSY